MLRFLAPLTLQIIALILVPILTANTPTVKYSSAYPKVEGHVIFEPLLEVDWKSLAPQSIASINRKKPKPGILKKLRRIYNVYTDAELSFDVPLRNEWRQGFYYLVTSGGIIDLELVKGRGYVRFTLNRARTAITEELYFGEMMAKAKDSTAAITEGGFALFSQEKLRFESDFPLYGSEEFFSASLEGENIRYRYQVKSGELTAYKPAEHPVKILKHYRFKITGDSREYNFVRWDADPKCNYGCCAFSYSLFEASEQLQEVKWTRYQCDL